MVSLLKVTCYICFLKQYGILGTFSTHWKLTNPILDPSSETFVFLGALIKTSSTPQASYTLLRYSNNPNLTLVNTFSAPNQFTIDLMQHSFCSFCSQCDDKAP